MKVFFIQTTEKIDTIVNDNIDILNSMKYLESIEWLYGMGLSSLFGINIVNLRKNKTITFFGIIANSKYFQIKWANEYNIKYNKYNWSKEILAEQIKKFKPDVLYTVNYNFFNKEMKDYLPKIKLYALWNASPMPLDVDLSYFDLGISFNKVYHNELRKRGLENVEYNSFYIDPSIKDKLDSMNLKKDIDISFCGRYSSMFKDRNQFLYDVYDNFKKKNKIKYYLLTGYRVKGLIPVIPFRFFKIYHKAVFLEDLFKVFKRSKIVLNTHSDITGEYKGNMRIFEVLGSGSFMLSDDGIYPKYLEPGKDFVTYKDKKDMLEKIEYYLNNDKEREEIALNGWEKISKYYSTEIGTNNLKKIFGKYL